jgi:hypothetical protein
LRKETLVPINQIISFEVIKPKQLILWLKLKIKLCLKWCK